jgi:hypothetical protein
VNSKLVAPEPVYHAPPPGLDPVVEEVTPVGSPEVGQGVSSPAF